MNTPRDLTDRVRHMWFPAAPVNGNPTLRCPCGKTWRCDRLEPNDSCTRFNDLIGDAR